MDTLHEVEFTRRQVLPAMYLRGKRTKRTNAETRAATAGESQRDVHTEVAQSSCSRSAPTGGSYVCKSKRVSPLAPTWDASEDRTDELLH